MADGDRNVTRLSARLSPRASRNEIGDFRDEVLQVRVTAPPVEGAANEALVSLLAERLDLPKANLSVTHGYASRSKVVEIAGLDRDEVLARLAPRPHGGGPTCPAPSDGGKQE